jgi:ArsR family transcriptional regulator, arsenate/arsenite/antimonite-responsive transcriptional repressor / arsenate reductase (thioredoxin)
VPAFLLLGAHPVRWAVLTELARSDLRVHELTDLVGQSQNLISYHLGRLRKAGVVSARRSANDGRDTYYSLDLPRCRRLLAASGAALHPALRLASPPTPAGTPRFGRGARVLFACTGNSARSQMAEAFLRQLTAGVVPAVSAGSDPKSIHPFAVSAMVEYGIDIGGQRSKHLDTFMGGRFSHVVTLCDRVREVCPDFGGGAEYIHWSVPDPTRDGSGYPAFQRTATELRTRVELLVHRLSSTMEEK